MATFVLTLGITTAIYVIQIGLRNLDTARTTTAVAQAMQSEMERLRLQNWTEISALPTSAEIDLSASFSSASIEADRVTVIRTVADVSGFGSPSTVRQISLTASWTSIDNVERTRKLVMRYARNGLFDYYYSSATS